LKQKLSSPSSADISSCPNKVKQILFSQIARYDAK